MKPTEANVVLDIYSDATLLDDYELREEDFITKGWKAYFKIANGLLLREQVGEAVYMAADCNHDDVIDSADVALLEQAGIILASVDQTKSEAELMTDSAFVEYLSLIDQSPAEETPVEEATDVTPAGEPIDEGFNKSFFERLIDFIIYIVNLMKSFIAKF